MKALSLVFFVCTSLLFYCRLPVPDMTPPKKVFKSFKIENKQVEWFSFSSAYAETPDVVTISDGSVVDTVCQATSIVDVKNIRKGTILISVYSSPKLYSEPIEIPQRVAGINVAVDTTYTPKARVNL